MRKVIGHVVMCFALVLAPVGFASAQQQDKRQAETIDKAQAAERAKQYENGRVLRVDQDRNTYRVKVLKKSGRVVSVEVDKRSGKVQPTKERDKER